MLGLQGLDAAIPTNDVYWKTVQCELLSLCFVHLKLCTVTCESDTTQMDSKNAACNTC